jgi:hypothetical protein
MLGGLGLGVAYGRLQQASPHGVLSGWLWRTLFTITVVLVTVPQILSAGINWAIEQDRPHRASGQVTKGTRANLLASRGMSKCSSRVRRSICSSWGVEMSKSKAQPIFCRPRPVDCMKSGTLPLP